MKEIVYLTDITGTIGQWLESEFDDIIPQCIISGLRKVYKDAVTSLNYKTGTLTPEQLEIVKRDEKNAIFLNSPTKTYCLYNPDINAYWDAGVSSKEEIKNMIKNNCHLNSKWTFIYNFNEYIPEDKFVTKEE